MTDDVRPAGGGDLTPPPVDNQTSSTVTPAVASPSPTPAVDPAASQPTTLADGLVTDKSIPTPADWPEDWRDRFADGDEKSLKRLARFTSPVNIFKSFRELEAKLSAGQTKAELPDNPTDEQLEAYRKETGVPVDGKYDTNIAEGFVWADADKGVLDDFSKFAHETNMPQSEFKKSLAWYADYQQRQIDAQSDRDGQFRAEAEDSLRREYGPEFRRNMNAIGSLFSTLPEEAKNNLFLARMPDGRLVGDHPEMVKFWAGVARELNPAATLIPGSTGDPVKGIAARKSEIEGMMSDRQGAYWKGPKANELQSEYRELIEAETKLKSRAA